MASTEDSSKKKAYHSPRLRVYGTVEELTQTSGPQGENWDYVDGRIAVKTG